jgi:hypothetical protein
MRILSFFDTTWWCASTSGVLLSAELYHQAQAHGCGLAKFVKRHAERLWSGTIHTFKACNVHASEQRHGCLLQVKT